MDSEWLNGSISAYQELVEQIYSDWQRTTLCFSEIEDRWNDRVGDRYRRQYVDEISGLSVRFIDTLNELGESLRRVMEFVRHAEEHQKALLYDLDEFSQYAAEYSDLISSTKSAISKAQDEAESAMRTVKDAKEILSQIIG